MSRVLITGACGYLGSQLLRDFALQLPDYQIRVLDNMQNHGHRALMNLEQGTVEFIEGDILDSQIVDYALEDVDIVVHLAAIVTTPMNFEHPNWVQQVNHWASSRLAEVCSKRGIKFIYPSSTSVYGPGGPFAETDSCKPIGPYASSKRNAERDLIRAGERGLEYMVLRMGSLFGLAPVMRFDGVANRLAYMAGIGRALTIYGSGEQRRPVVHVRDASKAVIKAINDFKPAKTYNVVSDNPSVLEIANMILSIRENAKMFFTEQDIMNHLSFTANSSEFKKSGWKPEVDLVEGLKEIIDTFAGVQSY